MRSFFLKARQFFSSQPLFILLFPVFFIYSGYNELFGFLSFSFVLLNFLFILAGISFVYIVSYFFFRDKKKATVFSFFIALIFLTFGFLHDSIKKIAGIGLISKFSFLLPLLLLLFIGLLIVLKRHKKGFEELYSFLNLLFVILIVSEIPNSVKRYNLDRSVHNLIDFRFNAYNEYKPVAAVADSLKPDIYFLLFDALASSKSVLQTTGKNGLSPLDSHLKEKGFYLAENAKANYNWTIHSVSTTLNMDYLPPWIAPVMHDPKVYFWGSSSFLDNSLFKVLKQEGYQVKNYQPISFGNNDWKGESYFTNLKKHHYYFKTLPGRVYRDIFWNLANINNKLIKGGQNTIISKRSTDKKEQLEQTLLLVKKSCSEKGIPKFIYGHFMIPHDPYVFDSSGNLKPMNKVVPRTKQEDLDGYYNQLIYASVVIKDLVNFIQLNNKKNTIIIVAGDHGFKTEEARAEGYTFSNYSAFYFPDHNYADLYPSISPVNSFRIILNKYFRSSLPILKDSSTLVVPELNNAVKKNETIPSR